MIQSHFGTLKKPQSMLHCKIISVSHKLPDWLEQGLHIYRKRLQAFVKLKEITVAPVKRSKNKSTQSIKSHEASLISDTISSGLIIALDERGQQCSTTTLANKINQWQQHYSTINLIIGGTDGLDASMVERADFTWSLSQHVFTHGLARLLVTEQLYRAYAILNNHPYHRE